MIWDDDDGVVSGDYVDDDPDVARRDDDDDDDNEGDDFPPWREFAQHIFARRRVFFSLSGFRREAVSDK